MTLFDLPDLPDPEPPLSADARRTARNRASLERGTHPATGRPLLHPEWGMRCADCLYCVSIGRNRRSFWKCTRSRLGTSRSAASDIRLSWPACTLLTIAAEATP